MWCDEAVRMNRPAANVAERLLANSRSSAFVEWKSYPVWLVLACERLATGAPSETVETDWIERRHRLPTVKPRHV